MKIHDVIIEQQINEIIDLKDFSAFIKSVMSNIGKPGYDWEDIKRQALRDRAIQLAARAFIEKWKNLRANYMKEYGESYRKNPQSHNQVLRTYLARMAYQEVGSSAKNKFVGSAIDEIFNAGDRLNSSSITDAAAHIITSGVARNMPLTISPDSQEDKDELNNKQKESPNVMDYGAKLKNELVVSQDPDELRPSIIVDWSPSDGSPPARFVKYNNVWYLDLSDKGNQVYIPPNSHVSQKSNDKKLRFAAQNAQRYAEVKWAGGEPPENWIVQFLGLEITPTPRVLRIPPPKEQDAWKIRTGREK